MVRLIKEPKRLPRTFIVTELGLGERVIVRTTIQYAMSFFFFDMR